MGEMGHPEYMGDTRLVDVKDGCKAGGGSAVKCRGIQSRGTELELWALRVRQKAGWSSHGKTGGNQINTASLHLVTIK